MRTSRRSLLLASGAVALGACSDPPPTSEEPSPAVSPTPSSPRVLLAYFSRAGENYHYGGRIDLEVGNTKVLAEMIADRIDCDLHEVLAADPYSADYDATVQRNVEEQDADARPEIADALPDVREYDVVVLASPLWNVRPPMIVLTFAEALDFSGKRVHPVVTYAVSRLGTAEREYAEACPGADLGEPLAVLGEEVADAGADVDTWLRAAALAPA